MKPLKYHEIQHLIPQDSVYSGYENEIVLFYEGDWTTDKIDLDYADKLIPDYTDKEFPLLILVNGNVNIKNIFNGETDGSTGLIVLGNLTADNIVVGGQEIYVSGDLNVSGLYWGDYNHGNLEAKGTINIRVFLETDYGYDDDRFEKGENINIPYILLDGNEEYLSGDWIRALFRPEFILSKEQILQYEDEIYGWKSWLNTQTIFQALEKGEPLLLPVNEVNQSVFPKPEIIPFLFENDWISYENLQRFGNSKLPLPNEHFSPNSLFYEYWKDDIFRRIFVNTENADATQVYFQKDEKFAVYVVINPPDKKLVLCFSENVFDPKASQLLDLNEHQDYLKFFQEEWEKFQEEISTATYYQEKFNRTITKEIFDEILNLRIIKEKYSNYYSDESEYWFSKYCWQFRQVSDDKAARISIAIELDNQDFEFFHYELEGEQPRLYTQDGNGYEFQPYEIPFSDTEKYKKGIQIFEILKKNIFRINEEYVNKK